MYQVISSEEMTQYTSKGKKQHHSWTLIPPSSFTGPLPGQSQKPTLPASLAPYQANLKSQYCQLHWPLARPISKANIASFTGPLPGQSQKPILPNSFGCSLLVLLLLQLNPIFQEGQYILGDWNVWSQPFASLLLLCDLCC